MTIRAQIATLCDAANVREGLLSVLGGGISILQRQTFPAPLGVSIAVLLEIDEAPASAPIIRFSMRMESGESVDVADFLGELDQALLFTDFPATLPVILNANDLMLPVAAAYQLKIYVDDSEMTTIRFRAFSSGSSDSDDLASDQQEVYSG